MYEWSKTQYIAITGMFVAIIFLMTILNIGVLPLGILRPTTLHIPVIVGALLMGPKYGAFLGFSFGLASMLFATFTPGPTSFVFSPFINLPGTSGGSLWALLVAFVPRILIGVVAWYAYAGVLKLTQKRTLSLGVAGIAGSLTNTILVLHLIYLLFGQTWNAARAEPSPVDAIYTAILWMVATNGVPEAIVAAILVVAIVSALSVGIRKRQG